MGWGEASTPWPLARVSAERVAELEQQVEDLRAERDEARAQLAAERLLVGRLLAPRPLGTATRLTNAGVVTCIYPTGSTGERP